jgi:hypothetical protein
MKNFPSTLCDELEFQNTNIFFCAIHNNIYTFLPEQTSHSNQSALLLSNVAVGRVGCLHGV